MSEINEVLKQSKVFSCLDEDALGRLAGLFEGWEIHPGDTLACAGDTANTFFLLGQGMVLLEMEEGKALVVDEPGSFIGLELLSSRGIYKTTAIVLERGRVFAVSRQSFIELIQEDSDAAAAIMESWQLFIEEAAPFAKNEEDADLPEQF